MRLKLQSHFSWAQICAAARGNLFSLISSGRFQHFPVQYKLAGHNWNSKSGDAILWCSSGAATEWSVWLGRTSNGGRWQIWVLRSSRGCQGNSCVDEQDIPSPASAHPAMAHYIVWRSRSWLAPTLMRKTNLVFQCTGSWMKALDWIFPVRTLGSTTTLLPLGCWGSSPGQSPWTHMTANTWSHQHWHPAKFNIHTSRPPQLWCCANLINVMERDAFSSAYELDYSPQQETQMFLLISRGRFLNSGELEKHSFFLFYTVKLLCGKVTLFYFIL